MQFFHKSWRAGLWVRCGRIVGRPSGWSIGDVKRRYAEFQMNGGDIFLSSLPFIRAYWPATSKHCIRIFLFTLGFVSVCVCMCVRVGVCVCGWVGALASVDVVACVCLWIIFEYFSLIFKWRLSGGRLNIMGQWYAIQIFIAKAGKYIVSSELKPSKGRDNCLPLTVQCTPRSFAC